MFVIQHTVAESFEVFVCDLVAEFLANTLRFGGPFQAAGAISPRALQSLFDGADDFFVGIEYDVHGYSFHPRNGGRIE